MAARPRPLAAARSLLRELFIPSTDRPKPAMAAMDRLGSSVWLLPALLCLALVIQSGQAIMCWECNSHYDKNCADPFRNSTFALTDCNQRERDDFQQKATVCRKIIQKVRDDYRFVRGCGWLSAEKEGTDCFKRAGTFNVLIQYCGCDSDGCNAAPHTTRHSWIGLLAAVILSVIVVVK